MEPIIKLLETTPGSRAAWISQVLADAKEFTDRERRAMLEGYVIGLSVGLGSDQPFAKAELAARVDEYIALTRGSSFAIASNTTKPGSPAGSLRDRIIHVAEQIPVGSWTTYGDVAGAEEVHASAIGVGGQVGAGGIPNDHRILNYKGKFPESAPASHVERLMAEGVRFINGRADPGQRWRPVSRRMLRQDVSDCPNGNEHKLTIWATYAPPDGLTIEVLDSAQWPCDDLEFTYRVAPDQMKLLRAAVDAAGDENLLDVLARHYREGALPTLSLGSWFREHGVKCSFSETRHPN